ncbi:ATPase PAAT [Sceloporus undulatus]|uniref:ATPase PAAT n=1 Tax=Sceloporus undulatus TaxID=8520 RepID=UPI001C4B604D|nr:ATPase PAAT [Sceloporus undulatus]
MAAAAAAASGSSLRPAALKEEGAPAEGGPRISASCSWECRGPGLEGALRLVPEGEPGAWELLGAPLESENIVVLERRLNSGNITPCSLYLHCDTYGSEEIVGLGIVSEARNMEVYVGEEYCATGRGEKICTMEYDSKNDHVTLYKKYLKLECSTASCKIKLLSINEKQRVLLSKILVLVKSVSKKSVQDFATLGSGIDIGKVQTIMESMGSKLSPGAQQLLDMVRFQQRNGLPFGGNFQNILGRNGVALGNNHIIDGLKKAVDLGKLDNLPSKPSLLNDNREAGMLTEDLSIVRNKQLPNMENTFDPPGPQAPQASVVVSQSDFKGLVSSFLEEQGIENPNVANSTLLLPFLQTVCGQVNRLRIDERNKHCENNSVSEADGIQTIGIEQQSVCLYLEKIISKKMEVMEKRLMDHIDLHMQKLQEHVDNKIAAIMDVIQVSSIVSQEHDPFREENSDGKR